MLKQAASGGNQTYGRTFTSRNNKRITTVQFFCRPDLYEGETGVAAESDEGGGCFAKELDVFAKGALQRKNANSEDLILRHHNRSNLVLLSHRVVKFGSVVIFDSFDLEKFRAIDCDSGYSRNADSSG
jgi:hypothetical protein